MEELGIFGIELKVFIFQIFLPALLFYLIIYVFLKRSNIFGKVSNYYYSITSLTMSVLSVFSLYSLGLTYILPYIAGILAVLAFFLTYVYGIFRHSYKVIEGQNFPSIVREIQDLIEKYEKANEEEKKKIKSYLREKFELAKEIAKKKGIKIEEENWYKKCKEIVG